MSKKNCEDVQFCPKKISHLGPKSTLKLSQCACYETPLNDSFIVRNHDIHAKIYDIVHFSKKCYLGPKKTY